MPSSQTPADYASLNPKGFRAHDNHVIVVQGALKTKTEGGLHLPRGVLMEPGVGVVISIGHGVERLKIGDKVTWKDSVALLGSDKMVTNDSSVWVDRENNLICVRKDMIIAVREGAGTT
jgi:co-chaperonin GroES (HSP10)